MARHLYACGTLGFLGTVDSCVVIYRQLAGDFGRFTGQQPTSRVPEGGPDGGMEMEGGLDVADMSELETQHLVSFNIIS